MFVMVLRESDRAEAQKPLPPAVGGK